MELGEPDASGRRSPVEIPGSEFTLDVDTVIMALGTSPNPLIRSTTPGLEANKRGCLVVGEDTVSTTREGVFAGGDAVTGAATVILAMGAGKKQLLQSMSTLKQKKLNNKFFERLCETMEESLFYMFYMFIYMIL